MQNSDKKIRPKSVGEWLIDMKEIRTRFHAMHQQNDQQLTIAARK